MSATIQRPNVWAITSFFTFDDPPGVARRLAAYREFRRRLDLPLIAVELSSDGAFDLTPADADIVVQRAGGSVVWQKERLLNVALDALPPACDTVVWIDCDIAFERDDWVEAACGELERQALVQPFRYVRLLAEGETPENHRPAPAASRECVVAMRRRNELPEDNFRRQGSSLLYRYNPGLAWVARRSLLERVRFYDAMIMGSGDKAMFSAACGRHEDAAAAFGMSSAQRRHYYAWARPFAAAVGERFGYIEGEVHHFWHGDLALRRYTSRYQGFEQLDFDPAADVRVNAQGVWEWTTAAKPELQRQVQQYFRGRQGVAQPQAAGAVG